MFEATPPRDVTIRQGNFPYQIDAPPYNPQNPPIPLIPAQNFRDQRFQYDTTPIPAPPPGWAKPPANLALIDLLNRIYGQG